MGKRLDPGDLEAAAAAIADAEGIDAVTMTSVARRLGVRAPSLYGHVPDRSALLERLTLHALARLGDELAVATAGLSGRDALAALAGVHRRFAAEHPGSWAALQRPVGRAAAADPSGARLVALMHGALRGYGLPEDDLVHAVRLLGATVHGFVSLSRSGGFAHSAPDVGVSWERAIDALHALFLAWPAGGAIPAGGEAPSAGALPAGRTTPSGGATPPAAATPPAGTPLPGGAPTTDGGAPPVHGASR